MLTVPLISSRRAAKVVAEWALEHDLSLSIGHGMQRYQLLHPRGPSRDTECLYFAAPDSAGPIKIGHSRSPLQRIASLRWEKRPFFPIVVISDNGQIDEYFLHQRLRRFAERGEFYRANSPVVSLAYRLANAAEACVAERFAAPRVRRKAA